MTTDGFTLQLYFSCGGKKIVQQMNEKKQTCIRLPGFVLKEEEDLVVGRDESKRRKCRRKVGRLRSNWCKNQ